MSTVITRYRPSRRVSWHANQKKFTKIVGKGNQRARPKRQAERAYRS